MSALQLLYAAQESQDIFLLLPGNPLLDLIDVLSLQYHDERFRAAGGTIARNSNLLFLGSAVSVKLFDDKAATK